VEKKKLQKGNEMKVRVRETQDDSGNSCLPDIALEILSLCFSLKENQVTHLLALGAGLLKFP